MLSTDDLETLIVSKKREIEKEKTLLGIGLPSRTFKELDTVNADLENSKKKVIFTEDCTLEQSSIQTKVPSDQRQNEKSTEESDERDLYDIEEKIPPDLERYIRRYVGIPAMLKAGEYSPNNPLLRAELNAERAGGDAFPGLGEYERRRNTLRKIRQAQYRQYLDQQAKKKQEEKEQAERERREREEKERQREERERQLLLERDRYSSESRRASVCSVPVDNALVPTAYSIQKKPEPASSCDCKPLAVSKNKNRVPRNVASLDIAYPFLSKVDTGVQVNAVSHPLSVAVQTDDVDMYQLSPSLSKCLTQAERELSPRTVGDTREPWSKMDACERRRSYGDLDERTSRIKLSNRDKLVSELRHSYMPSIFDADAIQMRNLQHEKEAAARRQFYQQELKNQILEQQRIREERKSREKMLEQAEMRRLEEQLRMLRVAQEREKDKHYHISAAMKDNAKDFDSKRTALQREIDSEQLKLVRATTQPLNYPPKRPTNTSKSDTPRSKLPFHYTGEKTFQPIEKDKRPYSFNIPDNSIFSANYDVDTILRKNLNFRDKIDAEIDNIGGNTNGNERNMIIEKAFGHESKQISQEKSKHEQNPSNLESKETLPRESRARIAKNNSYDDLDNISIPVLRHSPQDLRGNENGANLSDAMKRVDDKWRVPVVQKNILKSLPNEQGKNLSILTQLGSIRRQLQLEQLKLDKMLTKSDS